MGLRKQALTSHGIGTQSLLHGTGCRVDPEVAPVPQELFWLIDLIQLTLLGALIGGLTVGFSDYWAGEKVPLEIGLPPEPRWDLCLEALPGCWRRCCHTTG